MHDKKIASNRRPREPRAGQMLLSIGQVETVTGIPATSVRDLIIRGILPAVRLGVTRRLWIRRTDLEKLIERSVISAEGRAR